jgi:hypothetical protein
MAPSVVGLEGTIRSGKGESNPGNHELSDSGEIPGNHDSDDSPGHGASRWPVRRARQRTATSPRDIPYGENGILLRGVRPGNRVPVRQGRLPRSDSRWIRPMPRRR